MNMLERFFSNKYQGQGEIFENLNIWKDEKYKDLQRTYLVLFCPLRISKNKTETMQWKV